MIPLDRDKVLLNARSATDEDLLDRVTVYRDGMEPAAVAIFEAELRRRGVSSERIVAHANQAASVRDREQLAVQCSWCRRPAVTSAWGWHRLFGRVPLFPRRWHYCAEHRGR